MGGKETIVSNIQKRSQDYELICTAYHEAGHTIAGLLHFLRIPSVSVNYTAKSVEGFTHYEVCDQPVKDNKISDYLLMSEIYTTYAGLVAEQIHYKDICGADRLPMILKEGSSPDILAAAELIAKNNLAPPGKKRHAFKKQIFKTLTIDLKEHWDAVKLIAHALYKRKKLYEEDLKDILTKKTKNKLFWKNRFKEIDFLVNSEDFLDEKEIRFILFK